MGVYDEKGVTAEQKHQAEELLPLAKIILSDIRRTYTDDLEKLPLDAHEAVQLCRTNIQVLDTMYQRLTMYAQSGGNAAKSAAKEEVQRKVRNRASKTRNS